MTRPRPSRLLALLSLLQARRDWPGPLLAERLERQPAHRPPRRRPPARARLPHPRDQGPGRRVPARRRRRAAAAAVRRRAGDRRSPSRSRSPRRPAPASRRRRRARSPPSGRSCPRGCATASTRCRSAPSSGRADRSRQADAACSWLSAAVHAREVLRFDYAPAHPPAPGTDIPPRRVRAAPRRHLGRALVPRRLGPRPRRLADRSASTGSRPRTPTGPRFTPPRATRRGRERLRRRPVPGRVPTAGRAAGR